MSLDLKRSFPKVIDSTIRSTYVACPRKFELAYINNLVPAGISIDLHAGACFAKGLQITRDAFFAEHLPADDAIGAGLSGLTKAWGDFGEPEDTQKSLPRMLGALESYFSQYPLATDYIAPLILNGKPCTEFSFALPLDIKHPETGDPLLYSGRFDMLGVKDEALFIVDEKTTKQLGPTWGNQWTMRSQFTGYAWGARQYRFPVAGAIIRGISILKGGYGHVEAIIYREEWKIDRWLKQLYRDIEGMIRCYREGYFDYNLDHSCSNYGGCGYMRLCDSEHPENWHEPYYKIHVWNPLQRAD